MANDYEHEGGRSAGDARKKAAKRIEYEERSCRDCGAPCGAIGLCDLCFDEIQKEMLENDYRFGRS